MTIIYSNMEYMDLLQTIRIFKRVSEKQSFSAVATEFNVTQPTISKAVASLEKQLGVTLFRRTTRGLTLTAEGDRLFQLSHSAIDQFDLMLATVKSEKMLLHGQLRITASLAFVRLIVSPLLGEFSSRYPELRFHFHLSDGYLDLIENKIDLAIRIGSLQDSGLRSLKVGQSTRRFFASKKYMKKFGEPKSLADLSQHRLLFFTRISDRPSWPLIDGKGKSVSFQFDPYFQSDGSDLVRELVLDGAGIAYLPTWMMIGPEPSSMAIKSMDRFCGTASPIYILSSGTQGLTAKQKAFAEFLKLKFETIAEVAVEKN